MFCRSICAFGKSEPLLPSRNREEIVLGRLFLLSACATALLVIFLGFHLGRLGPLGSIQPIRSAADWPAWIQAIGSLVAIAVAIAVSVAQHRQVVSLEGNREALVRKRAGEELSRYAFALREHIVLLRAHVTGRRKLLAKKAAETTAGDPELSLRELLGAAALTMEPWAFEQNDRWYSLTDAIVRRLVAVRSVHGALERAAVNLEEWAKKNDATRFRLAGPAAVRVADTLRIYDEVLRDAKYELDDFLGGPPRPDIAVIFDEDTQGFFLRDPAVFNSAKRAGS